MPKDKATILYWSEVIVPVVVALGYRILPVNSRGYYKFQVEIDSAANWDFISKLWVRHKFMVFNLVLHGDYLSHGYKW